MIDLEKVKVDVLKGKSIEEVLEKFNWKEFEETVAEIFRNDGFNVKQNFRFKTKRRYEIDIVAVREDICICVDCKEWSRGRYKKTGLKYAVRKMEERLNEFKKFLKKNPVIDGKLKFYPMIVTLLEETLVKERHTFIVPVYKLNSFLLEYEYDTEPDGRD